MKDKDWLKLQDLASQVKLKNCPFCNEPPDLILQGPWNNHIRCSQGNNCSVTPATGYYGRLSDCVNDWNQRKGE